MTTSTEKNQNAVALGMKGGKKGGDARANKLTPEQKTAIARQGAEARWAAVRARNGNAAPSSIADAPSRTTHIKVLLTEEQRETLEQAARPSGQSVSAWVLTVALELARSG